MLVDVSPAVDATDVVPGGNYQSVSGKALCIACSPDGQQVYLGGHSGVWRSSDAGHTWQHPEWSQPPPGQTHVPGALLVPNVYDLLVSPTVPGLVLAATGRDARRPEASGIFRSTNAGGNWTRVHQFLDGSGAVGLVGCLAVAPDAPSTMFAAGQFAVGVSTDGGLTWIERTPPTPSVKRIFYVVAGPQQGVDRRVYAVGSHVWHSRDGGISWHLDPSGKSVASPTDGPGESSRAVAIHPLDPKIIYVRRDEELWRGEFSGDAADGGTWTRLPSPPIGYAGTTASGGSFVLVHAEVGGRLLMLVSDRRTTHIAIGEPDAISDWTRVDGGNVHVDPHGMALTPDFRRTPSGAPMGRAYLISDGGAYTSTDGGQTWTQGKGLSTLGLVNAAVLPRHGHASAICIGMGDNSGFYTFDGGSSWRTQDYLGGDNDCCFADPGQPSRLIVFAPRAGTAPRRRIYLYVNPDGGFPDATFGTAQRLSIPGPPAQAPGDAAPWNAVSPFVLRGYRPLVLTAPGESPRADGDLVTIRLTPTAAKLLRTTSLSQITSPEHWVTNATAEGAGVKAFQVGPDLPNRAVDVVQAAGGHARPTFYVSDSEAGRRLWKLSPGSDTWRQLVPGNMGAPPSIARRFFVDPWRPQLLYVLDDDHVRRSHDGGDSWVVDASLERALTQGGTYPFDSPYDATPAQALLRDMAFDPVHAGYRFAAGPAGVFYTLDGTTWTHLLLATALAARPMNLTYVPGGTACDRALYVATSNRGLLRVQPLPPEWESPIGSIQQAQGRIALLRVHDVGTKYGPPNDQLDADVVVVLDTEPEKALGFRLRTDASEHTARGQLGLLRDAFNQQRSIRVEYERTGCRIGRIIRVIETT